MDERQLPQNELPQTPESPTPAKNPRDTSSGVGNGSEVNSTVGNMPDTRENLRRPLTPSTEDRAAVLAPDDTFPGSGPLHRDRY